MSRHEISENTPLTWDNFQEVVDTLNEAERIFAFACLENGLILTAQVPVPSTHPGWKASRIDFQVINPKNPASTGKFVEVTSVSHQVIYHPLPRRKNQTDHATRKKHQRDNMAASGQPWTLLTGENIAKIKKTHGDPMV